MAASAERTSAKGREPEKAPLPARLPEPLRPLPATHLSSRDPGEGLSRTLEAKRPAERRSRAGQLQTAYGNRFTQQVIERARERRGETDPGAVSGPEPGVEAKGKASAPGPVPTVVQGEDAHAAAARSGVAAPQSRPLSARFETDAGAPAIETAMAGQGALAVGAAPTAGPAAGDGSAQTTRTPGEPARGEGGAEKGFEAEPSAESSGAAAPPAAGAGPSAAERAPASPGEDPAFQGALARVGAVAHRQGHNNPAERKVAEAQAAAQGPANELQAQAKATQVSKMDAQEPAPFDRDSFKAALLAKIAEITPTTLEQAYEFKKEGKAKTIKGSLTSSVAQSKEGAAAGIESTAKEVPDAGAAEPKVVTPLPPTDAGAPPPSVGAEAAAPKPKAESEVSLAAESQGLDQQMIDADVTEEQLQSSNEPEFSGALRVKQEAQTHAAEAPAAYREEEQGVLLEAQSQAVASAQEQTQGMHSVRGESFSQIAGEQQTTKSSDELKRAEISQKVEAIYESTRTKVEARLQQVDEEVTSVFDAGAEQARIALEDHISARMSAYKRRRYSGLSGAVLWAKDKLLGMPSEVDGFYSEGRDVYIREMDGVIDRVATAVETGLSEAKSLITTGLEEVQAFVESLPAGLQQMGQDAASAIQGKFDSLRSSVDEKRDQLVDSLARKYADNLTKIDESIKSMKAENRGLVDAAVAAIGGVLEKIRELKALILGVAAQAAAVIGKILKDPIGFVGNLAAGVKAGLQNFVAHIGAHLKKGLMGWLFGALAEAGIEMPESFDLKGILSLVLQVLGLTYANIRSRAVAIVGEKVVSTLEQTAEVFKVLLTQGPVGLWQYIKDKIGDLKTMILDGIQSFVIEKIIIAGITWVVSLLNPASAFIKACKAIYDIIMFFVNRASQIMALVTAVVNSLAAIASGAIGAVAAAVENALSTAVPVVISFLASLLGLGGISAKIRSIIEKIQAPINKAIDWVIHKAVKMVKAIGGFLTGNSKKKEIEETKESDPEKAAKIEAGLFAIDQREQAMEGEDAALTKEEAKEIASQVRQEHPVFTKLVVVDGGETWDYLYEASPGRTTRGSRQAIPKMKKETVTFNINTDKYDPKEYRDQLKGQQAGLNAMTIEEWERNYKAYHGDEEGGIPKRGRDPEAAAHQKTFREKERAREIEERKAARDRGGEYKGVDQTGRSDAQIEAEVDRFMKTQAALHDPDQVAGGGAGDITKLGSKYINSSIGSQWRTRHPILKAAVDEVDDDAEVREKVRMNVELKGQEV